MGQHAQRRPDGSGYDGVDAESGSLLDFIGQRRRERRQTRLARAVSPPEGPGILRPAVEREHDGGVRRLGQQRQQRPRQCQCRRDIDAQHPVPGVERLVLGRSQRAQRRGDVDERIEPANLPAQRTGSAVELVGGGGCEVEWQDRRRRPAGGDDLVVQLLEPAHDAAVDDHRGAGRGAGQRQRAPQAAAGTCYEDRPAGDGGCAGVGGCGSRHGGAGRGRQRRQRRDAPGQVPGAVGNGG